MELYGNVWKINGNVWKCIANLWKSMEMHGNVLKCIKMSGNELKLSLSFLAIFSVFWLYGKFIENLMENHWKCMEMYKMYRKIYEKIYRNL